MRLNSPHARIKLVGRILIAVTLLSRLSSFSHADSSTPTSTTPVAMVTVQPTEDSLSILNNPWRGWESNNAVASDYKEVNAPPSKIAYFKYYLKTFLREDGRIDLSQLEIDLERAKFSGQQIAFRLMIFAEEEGGEILRAFGVTRGRRYYYNDGSYRSKELWAPDLEDEITQQVLKKLLMDLGKRFDGDPALAQIDIGYVGLWGEWHTSDTEPKLPMPNVETQKRIIDWHFEAFPKTRKLMQLQDATILRYALSKGAGIRADCLADSSTTMMKLYPLTLLAAGAESAWKEAPFVFEICWQLADWEKKGWDSAAIFSTVLEHYHASLINTKSAQIPATMRPAFDQLLRRIGYRFVLREVRHPKTAAFSAIPLSLIFENTGTAPCYADARVLVQLKSQTKASTIILKTPTQLCGHVPGKFEFDLSLRTAQRFEPGIYDLSVAIAEADGTVPYIKLANSAEKDGWYSLSTIHLE